MEIEISEIKEQRYTILNFLYNHFFEQDTKFIHIDEIIKLYPEKPNSVASNLQYLKQCGYVEGKLENPQDKIYSFARITKQGIDYIESLDKK